ncbi:glycosyltransferase family 39 protein [Pseudofrankia sp. BMG5.36]|uniref:ArnT family glycosyltransferase n=1 Tax=Pseudofrankia sp. BMG5.36 TaxID=1834512 RepID=UPI000A4FE0C7|nr:glycosyltransferase family 39 protein [Pseudofrankia sp. BMG5.36]
MTTHEPVSRATAADLPGQRAVPDDAEAVGAATGPTAAAGTFGTSKSVPAAVGAAGTIAVAAPPAPAGPREPVGQPGAADLAGLAGPYGGPADGGPGDGGPGDGGPGDGGPGWRGRLARVARGPADDPRWARPALLVLLAATAVLYLWGLGRSGWANAFYSAAAQAGGQSWKALFYGSSDAGNSITVDKPPVAMWLMSLSVRIFGLSSWSILVPEALCGVASVGLLYATVRRAFSPAAGLIAGLVLATTPVAVLMFRFNNPDALLVLLLIGAAYATLRAVERASARWLALAGVLVGFGFLTKMLQAFLIVPVLAVVYLVAAPTGIGRRVRDVLLSGLALVASAGWYIAVVELVPASARPYIGGSQHNSILELTLGYNGFGRLTGDETGSVGGGPGGGGGGAGAAAGRVFGPPTAGGGWGQTGWGRMFNTEIGGQVAWLLPAALALLVAGLWVTSRVMPFWSGGAEPARRQLWATPSPMPSAADHEPPGQPSWAPSATHSATGQEPVRQPRWTPRTDRARAAFLVWGGWLLVTGIVFSEMQGIFHPYYTVALAPAIGALVGMGSVALWERREHPAAAVTLAAVTALTAWWCAHLLDRTAGWHEWLRPAVLVVGLAGAVLLLGVSRLPARAGLAVAGLALAGCLLGPTSYALATADSPHTGALPSAGPSAGGGNARPAAGGFPGGQGRLGQGQGQGQQGQGGFPWQGGTMPGGGLGRGFGGGTPSLPGGQGGTGGQGGGMGGLLGATDPGADLVALLRQNSSAYTWAAAAVGSNNAAGYQLAADEPVMAIGGFNGTDPSPTLAQFQKYVAEGKIHYFIGGGLSGRGNGGSQQASAITAWVQENFTPTTVGGVSIYDLTAVAGEATDNGDGAVNGGTTVT